VVAAAVVKVQVRVDDDVDAGEVERLLAQRDEAGVHVGHLRAQLRHAGVDQHAGVGMVDDMDADRPALALDEQLGHQQRRDRGRRRHSPILPPPANCLPSRLLRSGVIPERWRTSAGEEQTTKPSCRRRNVQPVRSSGERVESTGLEWAA
jgi:hypothetical protein